ncbi:MAG: helix-turn-helix domain-containing protein [Tepidiformaceae bacterium]
MLTYTTLEGRVLDLTQLTDEERSHFARCVDAYRKDMKWELFMDDLVDGNENPLIAPGRRITLRAVEHPLYQAVHDLGDRLGIAQGKLGPSPGDDLESQPLDDTEVSIPDAAEQAGVSVRAVYSAIDRGDLIATRARPARVSQRSLERWRPNETRQRAGRSRAG